MKLRLALRVLIFAVPMSLAIQKAQDLASKGEYPSAMSRLRRAYSMVLEDIPSNVLTIEANMLSALVASHLNMFSLVRDCVVIVRQQLSEVNSGYSIDDIEYLKSYSDDLCRFITDQGYDLAGVTTAVGSRDAFDISRVRSGLKVMFPVFNQRAYAECQFLRSENN